MFFFENKLNEISKKIVYLLLEYSAEVQMIKMPYQLQNDSF